MRGKVFDILPCANQETKTLARMARFARSASMFKSGPTDAPTPMDS